MLINKDTRLCISLSGRPGNFGTRFHNYLYQKLGLNFVYKVQHRRYRARGQRRARARHSRLLGVDAV